MKKKFKINFKGGFLADAKKLRKKKGRWFSPSQPFTPYIRRD